MIVRARCAGTRRSIQGGPSGLPSPWILRRETPPFHGPAGVVEFVFREVQSQGEMLIGKKQPGVGESPPPLGRQ